MIKYLDGIHETPDYLTNTHVVLYKNDLAESYPPHWHFPLEVLMPTENQYTMIIDDNEIVVNPYDILFIAPAVIHSSIAPTKGERYFFQTDISRLKSISGVNHVLSFIGQYALFTPENSPEIHDKLKTLFEEICEEYFASEEFDIPQSMREGSDIDFTKNILCEPIIYGKLLTMFALIGRNHLANIDSNSTNQLKRRENIERFMKVTRYIDEHFTEDLSLDEVANYAGFSKFHFSRIFKQFTGISFYRYVNQARISYAEELLANPDLQVAEIAIRCGFSSSSSFIRMFKQLKGCTPTDFRGIREHSSFCRGRKLPETIYEEVQ